MTSPGLAFQDLAIDIIFHVFAFCDIYAVLSTAKTCRYLHALALDKSVWLAIMNDLMQRHFLDPVPNLRDLPTTEMLSILRQLVEGPGTWTRFDPDNPPVAQQTITLNPSVTTGPGITDWENEAKMVPGGRYLLFGNWGTLECWDIPEDKLVWTHPPSVHSAFLLGFAAHALNEDQSLIIALCEQADYNGHRITYVKVLQMDLQTGTHRVLLTLQIRQARVLSNLLICGELIAIAMTPERETYLFLNWKTQSACLFRSKLPLDLVLLPHHIVLKTPSSADEDEIHVISPTELRAHWVRIRGPDSLTTLDTFPPLLFEDAVKLFTTRIRLAPALPRAAEFGLPLSPRSTFVAHEDPLRRDSYRIWTYTSRRRAGTPQFLAGMHSFHLVTSASDPSRIEWRERTATQVLPHLTYRGITYSGHGLLDADVTGSWEVVAPGSRVHGVLYLADVGSFVHLGPYSGALTYPTFRSINIVRFA
ncbi:hypothetical protein B0H16DRAFT_1608854 [Mycena metata]|uniref:F-box domain-containing protein n=1 Tax=Mycena metata TaxID=1033252 RepID=A0AAD7HE41_9AGAR|nr:hypothetical protein B0H16DRAFT_1608854 [Mycena metata]